MAHKKHTNGCLKTSFACGGRFVGIGVIEDSYGDESFPDLNPFHIKNKNIKGKNKKIEEAPVKTYLMSKAELEKYKISEK